MGKLGPHKEDPARTLAQGLLFKQTNLLEHVGRKEAKLCLVFLHSSARTGSGVNFVLFDLLVTSMQASLKRDK